MRGRFAWTLLLGIILMSTACSRDPNIRKQKYLESGQRYFKKEKYQEAVIQFRSAIQVDPSFANAHYELARTYSKLQQWGSAYRELARVLELQPQNHQAELDLANLLIAVGSKEQAQEHTQSLLREEPNNWQVHLAQSSLLGAQGNFPAAIEEAEKATFLSQDQWQPYLNLAVMQTKTNKLDEAEIAYKKAAQLAPKATEPQLALARFYVARGKLAQAEEQFQHVIDIDPSNPEHCADLARIYMMQGKRGEAESFLRQAVRRFPGNPVGYRLLGDYYFALGDIKMASSEYESLYREHSSDIQVKKNYIQLLILNNQLAVARKLDEEILKNEPFDLDALVDQGQIQIRSGQYGQAIETLRAAIRNDPNNGLPHYYLGLALDANGNRPQAQGELQEAVRLRPDLTDGYRALAATALRAGDADGLEEYANHIIAQQESAPDGYLYRAVSLTGRKRFVQAEADIRKAMELNSQNPAAYIEMANLRVAQQHFAEAALSFQQALDLSPSSPEALGGLMNVYVAQNQPDVAVAVAHTQIGKVPKSSVFYDLLGTVLFANKKDLNGAQAAFEKAGSLDRNNSDALLKLAEVQIARGSKDEAIATCVNSLKEHPDEPSFYVLLGELYESKKDWENAEQMYQKALKLRPGNPLASNNLAFVLLQTGGNVDVALALAQTARRGMLDSPNAADTLGWVYYQKAAFRSAIDLFQEALRLSERNRTPDNPTFHYHLGLAYEKAGQAALAKEQFHRVLKISPNSTDAEAVKKELAQLMVAPAGQ
jgi:Flp pilus assembly protein TadD